VPPGEELFTAPLFSLCRRSLRRPIPVKIAATTANKFGNRAHLASEEHFVEAQGQAFAVS
jgi:hypothetical protein